MGGVSEVVSFVLQAMAQFWNFLYSGSGYIGLAIIFSFIFRKVLKFFKHIF